MKIAQMTIEQLYAAYREAPKSDSKRIGLHWLTQASAKRDRDESFAIELAAAREWLKAVAEEIRQGL